MLLPLLTVVSGILYQAKITHFSKTPEGFCIYNALVAQSSTGKTLALTKVQQALVAVESYLKIQPSKFANRNYYLIIINKSFNSFINGGINCQLNQNNN